MNSEGATTDLNTGRDADTRSQIPPGGLETGGCSDMEAGIRR
jgi:hypothetical protein